MAGHSINVSPLVNVMRRVMFRFVLVLVAAGGVQFGTGTANAFNCPFVNGKGFRGKYCSSSVTL